MGEGTPEGVCIPGGERPPLALERLSPAQAVAELVRQALRDPSQPADQATLDRLTELALSTPVFRGAPYDLGGDGRAAEGVEERFEALRSVADPRLDGVAAAEAYFRRAEGVDLRFIVGGDEDVTATRKGVSAVRLPAKAARLLAAMGGWRRLSGDELTWGRLFVELGLAWFCDHDPGRTLPCGVASPQRPALGQAWRAVPLVSAEGAEPRPLSFMPRMGEADDLVLRGFDLRMRRIKSDVGGARLLADRAQADALRRLLPELTGRKSADELLDGLPSALRDAGAAGLKALGEAGALEEGDGREESWSDGDTEGISVTWLQHASVLVRAGGAHLWVDPTTAERVHQPRRGAAQPPCRRGRPPLDALLITHGDNDHLYPATLVEVPPETPILIPSMAGAGDWQVDLPAVLALLGFTDVRALQDWETVDVEGARVTAVPFEGEDWGLHQCSCTWLVERDDRRVYLSADSAGMLSHAPRIAAAGPPDLALIGVSGNSEPHVMTPGYGYGDFYDSWIPEGRKGRFIRHTDGPRQACELAQALGAKRVFGYAAGGVPWMSATYSDEGDHAELAERLEAAGGVSRAVELRPGEPYRVP